MMRPMRAQDHPNNAPGVPMRFPPWFERIQIRYINPLAVPLSRFTPGVTVITHRGRKTGRRMETPVSAYRKGDTVAIMLAHGKTNSGVRRRCGLTPTSSEEPRRDSLELCLRESSIDARQGHLSRLSHISSPMSSTRTEWVSAPTAR